MASKYSQVNSQKKNGSLNLTKSKNLHTSPQNHSNSFENKTIIQQVNFVTPIKHASNHQPVETEHNPTLKAKTGPKANLLNSFYDSSREQNRESSSDLSSVLFAYPDNIKEPKIGETISVPDIKTTELSDIELSDKISSELTHWCNIARGGYLTNNFGVTRAIPPTLSKIKISREKNSYKVTAVINSRIIYQVWPDTGPQNQINITSEFDPEITKLNYMAVVNDLTPDMSRLNGQPLRDLCWAKDISIRHELFHANEAASFSRKGVSTAQSWLNKQTVSDVKQVKGFLNQVPGIVKKSYLTGMTYPAAEERAFGDGAPYYLARVRAIKAIGDSGKYPDG